MAGHGTFTFRILCFLCCCFLIHLTEILKFIKNRVLYQPIVTFKYFVSMCSEIPQHVDVAEITKYSCDHKT